MAGAQALCIALTSECVRSWRQWNGADLELRYVLDTPPTFTFVCVSRKSWMFGWKSSPKNWKSSWTPLCGSTERSSYRTALEQVTNLNWRYPIWWLKIVYLEKWSWQSPDVKWDEEPPADLIRCHDVPSRVGHDSIMFKHKSNSPTAITIVHYIQDHWASGLWPLSSIPNTTQWFGKYIFLEYKIPEHWHTQEFCSGGGSTNSVEDRGQREQASGGGSLLFRGSGSSCNLVQEI